MTRHGSESDVPTYSAASKPTALMPRDELLELVNASAAASVSANAVPRVMLEQRDRSADKRDDDGGTSSVSVLAIIAVLIALFAAIVLSAH